MFKWLRLIRFIKKHRKLGYSKFTILTTSEKIIVKVNVPPDKDMIYDKLQIPYK